MNGPTIEALAEQASTPAGLMMVVVLLAFMFLGLLGVAAYLLKMLYQMFAKQVESHGQQLEKLRDRVESESKHVAATYIQKEDFLLALTRFDRRQEQTLEAIQNLPCKNGGACGSA